MKTLLVLIALSIIVTFSSCEKETETLQPWMGKVVIKKLYFDDSPVNYTFLVDALNTQDTISYSGYMVTKTLYKPGDTIFIHKNERIFLKL